MSTKILNALLKKEFTLMRRNPLIPRVIIMLPIMAMLVIPLVANLDVKHANVVVVDNDRSQLTRRIIADIDGCDRLSVADVCATHSEAMRFIEDGEADVLLTLPLNYSRDMSLGLQPKADLEANGVNATKGALASQYAAQSLALSLQQWLQESGMTAAAANNQAQMQISVLNRYNPTLNFRNYMIPALIVILLIIICGFLPALNLVTEKESGTIEAMNVTPVKKFTFVLSKLIPYWIVGLIVVSIGMFIGWAVYGLAPQGNIAIFYLATALFTLIMSGFGVAVANKSDNMMQCMFVMFAVIMIFQLMSGLFTPIASMPYWSQLVTYAIPPRYFIEIMRALYLRGTPIADLWQQFVALACFAVIFCALAAVTYKKQS